MAYQQLSKFVSIFSGAGGLDIGFEQAGWSCAYASDLDKACVETLNLNKGKAIGSKRFLGDSFVERADIRDLRGSEILAKSGLKRGEPLALVGGPPCQSWSSAGHQLGFDDPRGQLIREYVRVAAELDARWLLFENVRGLLTARGPDGEPGSALSYLRNALLAQGFQSEVTLLNAADFGVPQRRVRLFLLGYRNGDRPHFPDATHSKDADLFEDQMRPWISLGDCLRNLTSLAPEEIIRPSQELMRLLDAIPDGSGIKSQGKQESTRPGGHWGYRQGCFIADKRLPARTVTASMQQDWVRDPSFGLRRLSPRECAAIQSFPVEFEFSGNRSAQYRQIGNAVPPLLGYSIGSSLFDHASSSFRFRPRKEKVDQLTPLPSKLRSAIEYTRKEEIRNGESRRKAPAKRIARLGQL